MKQEKKEFLMRLGFGAQVKNVDDGKCAFGCVIPKDVQGRFLFRDEISRREHQISGMCQACQDKTFGGSDGQGS